LGGLDDVERWGLNQQFEWRGPIKPKTPIVIVTIDEDDFTELGFQWPFPRALHAEMLDNISKGHPAAIGLDLVFPEPSSLGEADDKAMGEAVARAKNVVLGAAFTEVRTILSGYVVRREEFKVPVPAIRQGAVAFAFINYSPESDGFIREASLSREFSQETQFSLTYHLYKLGVKAGIPAAPLPTDMRFLINYRGGPKTFATISYYRLVSRHAPERPGQVIEPEFDPEMFKDKIVLVGAYSPVLHDVFPTPFATSGNMPGVEIHANTLETLFQGIPLRKEPRWLTLILTLAAAPLAVWGTNRMRPLPAFGAIMGSVVGYALVTFAAFKWGRVWMDIAPVPLVLGLGYGTTVVLNFIQEQREKRRLSRYFSPSVVREVIQHKEDEQLSSARRRMTILFSDIRGFTSISEKMSPEEVVGFLREYLTVMTDVVFKHGGTVDKYIGDAIMALFNAPFDQPDHAAEAVRTGLEFQERLRPLSTKFRAKYGIDLRCGVGIHTGDAVVGTIGSEQRLEYTAIGDTINLGSRLESITKDFHVSIIISESTNQELKDKFLTRYLGEVKVKGKEIPVKIYAVAEANSRKEARVPIEATLTILEDEVSIETQIVDLSKGGVAVRNLPKLYTEGQELKLRLDLSGATKPVDLDAKVVWSKDDRVKLTLPGSSLAPILVTGRVSWTSDDKAGFAFTDITPEGQAAIEDFLKRMGKKAAKGEKPLV
jgi:adenylate cyclase